MRTAQTHTNCIPVPNLKDLSIGNRINFVYKAKLCFNCFHASYIINKYKSRFNCSICKKKQYTILPFEEQNKSSVAIGEDKFEKFAKLLTNQSGSTTLLHGHRFVFYRQP